MERQRAIVAVLAGGHARRMGGAKATAMLAGRPLISYPLAAARDGGLERIVVAKQGTALPPLQERLVIEPELPLHPLTGVIAALDFAAGAAASGVVTLACDMPFLTGALVAWLAGLEGTALVGVGGRQQPLLARWEPVHRPRLQEALAEGESLTATMMALEPRALHEDELSPFGDPERLCFNVNTPQDLRMAEGWLLQ